MMRRIKKKKNCLGEICRWIGNCVCNCFYVVFFLCGGGGGGKIIIPVGFLLTPTEKSGVFGLNDFPQEQDVFITTLLIGRFKPLCRFEIEKLVHIFGGALYQSCFVLALFHFALKYMHGHI